MTNIQKIKALLTPFALTYTILKIQCEVEDSINEDIPDSLSLFYYLIVVPILFTAITLKTLFLIGRTLITWRGGRQ